MIINGGGNDGRDKYSQTNEYRWNFQIRSVLVWRRSNVLLEYNDNQYRFILRFIVIPEHCYK